MLQLYGQPRSNQPLARKFGQSLPCDRARTYFRQHTQPSRYPNSHDLTTRSCRLQVAEFTHKLTQSLPLCILFEAAMKSKDFSRHLQNCTSYADIPLILTLTAHADTLTVSDSRLHQPDGNGCVSARDLMAGLILSQPYLPHDCESSVWCISVRSFVS